MAQLRTKGTLASYTPTVDRPARGRTITIVLFGAAILLSTVGIAAATVRLVGMRQSLQQPASARTALSPIDEYNFALIARIRGAPPGSPVDVDARVSGARFVRKFAEHPVLSSMHLVPGLLLLLLMPLQFVRRIRARYLAYHRWAGRSLLVATASVTISAIYFGVFNPQVPGFEPPIIGAAAILMSLCGLQGFRAVRRGDVARHREWMIRTYAFAAAIATQRLLTLPLSVIFPTMTVDVLLMVTVWTCWIVTVGLAEVWIRRSRAFALVS